MDREEKRERGDGGKCNVGRRREMRKRDGKKGNRRREEDEERRGEERERGMGVEKQSGWEE